MPATQEHSSLSPLHLEQSLGYSRLSLNVVRKKNEEGRWGQAGTATCSSLYLICPWKMKPNPHPVTWCKHSSHSSRRVGQESGRDDLKSFSQKPGPFSTQPPRGGQGRLRMPPAQWRFFSSGHGEMWWLRVWALTSDHLSWGSGFITYDFGQVIYHCWPWSPHQ